MSTCEVIVGFGVSASFVYFACPVSSEELLPGLVPGSNRRGLRGSYSLLAANARCNNRKPDCATTGC